MTIFIIILSALYAAGAFYLGDFWNGIFLSTPAIFCILILLSTKIYKIKE